MISFDRDIISKDITLQMQSIYFHAGPTTQFTLRRISITAFDYMFTEMPERRKF